MATIAIILWYALYDMLLGSSGSLRNTATPNDPLLRLKAMQRGGRQSVVIFTHVGLLGESFPQSIFHFVHKSHSNAVSVFLARNNWSAFCRLSARTRWGHRKWRLSWSTI
jgi:hypothetical protein